MKTGTTRRVPDPVAVIVNPQSASGRTRQAWPDIRARLEEAIGAVEVCETEAPAHAIEISRSLIQQGFRTVIAVGGDGTIHEVVNGFFPRGGGMASDVVLGIIPRGTGSDLRRTLSIPLDEQEAIDVIRTCHTRGIDVAEVRYQGRDGQSAIGYSINITSFGMGGTVAARANKSSKMLGGRLSFLMATSITTLTFPGSVIRLQLDGQEARRIEISNVAVGNGQYHGAGMWICPRAELDDGLLDVTVIHRMSKVEVLRNLRSLYNGRIYGHPKVEFHRARRLEAKAEAPTLIEIDGEPLGELPLEISVHPLAVRVCVPHFLARAQTSLRFGV